MVHPKFLPPQDFRKVKGVKYVLKKFSRNKNSDYITMVIQLLYNQSMVGRFMRTKPFELLWKYANVITSVDSKTNHTTGQTRICNQYETHVRFKPLINQKNHSFPHFLIYVTYITSASLLVCTTLLGKHNDDRIHDT